MDLLPKDVQNIIMQYVYLNNWCEKIKYVNAEFYTKRPKFFISGTFFTNGNNIMFWRSKYFDQLMNFTDHEGTYLSIEVKDFYGLQRYPLYATQYDGCAMIDIDMEESYENFTWSYDDYKTSYNILHTLL